MGILREVVQHLCWHCPGLTGEDVIEKPPQYRRFDRVAVRYRQGQTALLNLTKTSRMFCALAQPFLYHSLVLPRDDRLVVAQGDVYQIPRPRQYHEEISSHADFAHGRDVLMNMANIHRLINITDTLTRQPALRSSVFDCYIVESSLAQVDYATMGQWRDPKTRYHRFVVEIGAVTGFLMDLCPNLERAFISLDSLSYWVMSKFHDASRDMHRDNLKTFPGPALELLENERRNLGDNQHADADFLRWDHEAGLFLADVLSAAGGFWKPKLKHLTLGITHFDDQEFPGELDLKDITTLLARVALVLETLRFCSTIVVGHDFASGLARQVNLLHGDGASHARLQKLDELGLGETNERSNMLSRDSLRNLLEVVGPHLSKVDVTGPHNNFSQQFHGIFTYPPPIHFAELLAGLQPWRQTLRRLTYVPKWNTRESPDMFPLGPEGHVERSNFLSALPPCLREVGFIDRWNIFTLIRDIRDRLYFNPDPCICPYPPRTDFLPDLQSVIVHADSDETSSEDYNDLVPYYFREFTFESGQFLPVLKDFMD